MHPTRLAVQELEARETPATAFRAFGAVAGGRPLVDVLHPNGSVLARFEAFESSFTGGVRAAAADLDGNPNTVEIIAGAGPGGAPAVQVYRVDAATGIVDPLTAFFAFDSSFRGGVRVAAGSVTGTINIDQIIIGAEAGGGPHVRVLEFVPGKGVAPVAGPLGSFFAFDPSFTGGVRVAAGELDGSPFNGDELVVAAGEGGGPRVRVIRSDGLLLADFFAFRPDFLGGVQVAVAPLGLVPRFQVDALPDDPSQRRADLNAAALGQPVPIGGTPPGITARLFGEPGVARTLPVFINAPFVNGVFFPIGF